MIRRTLDPTFLNSVANHPEVRPDIGGDVNDPVDLTPHVENLANIALEADGGGWLLRNLSPGLYDLHTLFLPAARGKSYFRQAREALRLVFTQYDVVEISTWCPDVNAPAGMAAGLMGFREWFRRERAWEGDTGISYRILTLDDWLGRDQELPKLGLKIHHLLGGEGLPMESGQGRALAAAVMMIRGGQVEKGLAYYERCGRVGGLIPVFMSPPRLLHVGNAILDLGTDEIEVLRGG